MKIKLDEFIRRLKTWPSNSYISAPDGTYLTIEQEPASGGFYFGDTGALMRGQIASAGEPGEQGKDADTD
jgi:hypothetical protein